ncbi:ADP-ribosylglycohydrolase [Streptomyces phaeoluteigriseus]
MGATGGAVWGRTEQQDFRSRVRGTMLGAAVGDALGAAVDRLGLAEIRRAHGPEGLVDLAPAYGRRGAVTHLTQLTLFSVDGLIRAQVRRDTGAWYPPTDLHRAYLRWAATQRDWGPDLRRKDDGWLAHEEWLYVRRDPARSLLLGFGDDVMGTLAAPKSPGEDGPEATARSAPFGLLVGWEPQLVAQLAVECAAQTHGHPGGYLTAGAYAVVVHAMARGDSLDGAVQRALALLSARPGHEPVAEALRHALGAVRQGMPGPARGGGAGRGGDGPGCAGGGRLLRPGRRGRTPRSAARGQPRRPLGRDRRADRRPARGAARRDGPPAGLAGRAGGPSHDPGTGGRLRDGDDPGARPAHPGGRVPGLARPIPPRCLDPEMPGCPRACSQHA